jgi:hypothetical protein
MLPPSIVVSDVRIDEDHFFVPGQWRHTRWVSHLKLEVMVRRAHRDKTRVQILAKMFPQLKLLCLLFMGPTLGFDTRQRNSFLIKFDVFNNKSKILTLLFIIKCEKITLFDEFLMLLVPIISRFFACSNVEKIYTKTTKVLALVLSLWEDIVRGHLVRTV